MRRNEGFSLIELVIAISLASFVLVGVATIASQMARSQIDGIRSGTATGWSLVSYMSMAKEIEDANVLAFPIANGAAADSLIVCKNWSRVVGGKLDTNAPGLVSVIQYCVDPTAPVAPETGFKLRRYANIGAGVVCPDPGVPVACSGAPTGTWTETGVVGFRLEKLTGFPNMFTRDNSIGGVRLRYAIGRQTPTANDPNPKSTPFDIAIAMQKQYNNPLD
ncbi:MAG: prepilin-type N-terminal cleavage/methylation domain-containing protein [Elusimicrobia bacterium]|nr:prepilin-type N-terminal cleavage/methylation domain-containing protein [Elusimicrobiota bacterium]